MTFAAPWSRTLRGMTAVALAILAGIALIGLLTGPRQLLVWQLSMVWFPIVFGIVSAFFVVRGYSIDGQAIRVVRLGWSVHLPLEGIESVALEPEALRGALRIFGNGGLFAFSGLFWSRKLGRFRAFATDPARSVVIRWAGRTVVLTPDDPARFVAHLRERAPVRVAVR